MCDREQPWARLKVPKLFYNTTACNELHSTQLCLFTRNISKLYHISGLWVFGCCFFLRAGNTTQHEELASAFCCILFTVLSHCFFSQIVYGWLSGDVALENKKVRNQESLLFIKYINHHPKCVTARICILRYVVCTHSAI